MNLETYLSLKYGVARPTTITYCEAKVFGIKYPLQRGWLAAYGHLEITADMAEQLKIAMFERGERAKSHKTRTWSKNAANVLKTASSQAKWTPKPTDPTQDAFLQSYEWRRIRMQAIKQYGQRCSCCGATAKDDVRLHVDHIKPRKLFPNLALDINNLQILCAECNHGKGNWDMTDWREKEKTNG